MKNCTHPALENVFGTDMLNYEYCPICHYSKSIPLTSDQIKIKMKYNQSCIERDRSLKAAYYYQH